MILFLDFDGVLHPCGDPYRPSPAASLFSRLPRLQSLLREYPGVRIVISSSWRTDGLDALKRNFDADISERVVGVTPLTPRDQHGYMEAVREREILAWLDANGGRDQAWVALDDADFQFPTWSTRLVVCDSDVGFDECAEAELRAHFDAWMNGTTINGRV